MLYGYKINNYKKKDMHIKKMKTLDALGESRYLKRTYQK